MKKAILWKIVLVLLPVLIFGLELMPDSVSVVLEDGYHNCSFFGTLPDGSQPFGLALAGMLTLITAVVALIANFAKKPQWYTALTWFSLSAATMSVLPILIKTKPPVLPTVVVTLLLLTEALLAHLYKVGMRKEGDKKLSGHRL